LVFEGGGVSDINKEMKDFYKAMLETADNCDMKILSDDFCCQLLAFTLNFGGSLEAVVMNPKMNAEIMSAQKRLNIYGGESPNVKLVPLLQKYITESSLKVIKINDKYYPPQWFYDICDRYELNSKSLSENGI
jgi:hypothetical protein